MSATTPSHALGSASERTPAASLPPDGDNRSSVDQSASPISALAIEALHGRFGCAVYVEEEHQLLLCEDLPWDFVVHDNGQLASARTTGNASEQHDDDVGPAAATGAIAAFGHASYGFLESCKHGLLACRAIPASQLSHECLLDSSSFFVKTCSTFAVQPRSHGRLFQMP